MREKFGRDVAPVLECLGYRSAKALFPGLMRCDELPKFIDGSDAVQIALALRVSPREQAVAAKYDAIAVRVIRHRLLQHQP